MFSIFLLWLFISTMSIAHVYAAGYAVVDMQHALETVKDGVIVKAKLEKEFKEKKDVIRIKENAIKEMKMNSDSQQIQIYQKLEEHRGFVKQSELEMQRSQNELTKPIIDKIKSTVQDIAKKGKYELVYEKNEDFILFHVKEPKDITSQVITKYDEQSVNQKQ